VEQDRCIIASDSDALWIHMGEKGESDELDLDEEYKFADIKCVEFYEGCFYILANRLDEIIGQYLFFVQEDMSIVVGEPTPELTYIIRQENKFNIGDASIDIMLVDREPGTGEELSDITEGEQVIQIVTSFKNCEENTFTIFVAHYDPSEDEYRIVFRYTSYQLWESAVKGFLSAFNQDFIIMNKEGMSYIRLDKHLARRSVQRKKDGLMMIHSLRSMNYLKVENGNMLNFENQLDDSKLVAI